MPRRLTPRSAKQRERQFWNWTRLGWTARQREEFFELLIERLYASGILVLDLRTLQNRLSVELFLRTQLDSIGTELDGEPDGWDELYEAKGKELLRRVRVALVARKRGFLAQMKAQGNPVRPDRPEEVIHREFNQAYETDSEGTSSPGTDLSHRKGDPPDCRNGRWIYLQNDFPTDSELERQPQSYLGASLRNSQVADTQESNSQGEDDNQKVASSSSRGVWSDSQGGIDTPVERDSTPLFPPEPAQHYTDYDEIPETQGSGPSAEEVDSESLSSVSHHNEIPSTQVSSSPADQYNVEEDDTTKSLSSVSGPDEIPDSQGSIVPAEEDEAENHSSDSPSSVSDHDEIPDSQEPGFLEEDDSMQLVAVPEFGPGESSNTQQLPRSGSSEANQLPENYSRLGWLPAELLDIIGQHLGFGDLHIFSTTSRRIRAVLTYERRRRLGQDALPPTEDYHRHLTMVRGFGTARFHLEHDPEAPYVEQPMLWAIENGWSGVLRAFLARGFSPDSCTLFGNNMLHVAVTRNQIDCVRALLDYKATLNELDPGTRMSPILAGLLARSDATFELISRFRYSPPVMALGEAAILEEHVNNDPMLRQWFYVSGVYLEDVMKYESTHMFIEMWPSYLRPE